MQLFETGLIEREEGKKRKEQKKKSQVWFLGIAERGGRTRSLKIKSLTLYRLS